MKKDQRSMLSRRRFLSQSACGSLGVSSVVNTLAHLSLINNALADQTNLGEYKAMVCVFLYGGMDSNNILIPRIGHPSRTDYDTYRGQLAIPDTLLAGIAPANTTDPYGLHPNLSQLAGLFNSGELGFVANTGSLAFPIENRDDFINGLVPVPPQLFSHSDQQAQWQSSIPDKAFQSGWGGRIAELLHPTFNPDSNVSMSISLDGINNFQVGLSGSVIQYAATTTGAKSLSGYGTNYANALENDGSYKSGSSGRRLKAFEDIMRYTHDHLFEEGYNKIVRRSRDSEGVINAAITEANASGVDYDGLFANADSDLGDQLKAVARLIGGRSCLGNQRQIFFVSMGGFDTHQDQNGDLNDLTTDLGGALKAFHDSLGAMGVNDQVLTCTNSDFTRTFTPNGDDPTTAGSDHGWGGHQIVMGGPVMGKKIYGTFPSLKVGQDNDTNRERGRWIPTTAVDQYAAVCARWLGVEAAAMDAIFPNLSRFDDPFAVSSANLDFVNLT
jgi:uncharacterized protein (DUF1501 family)